MRYDRSIEILAEGLKAAHGRLFRPEALKRAEYPHDFSVLYGRLEDDLYELYGSVTRSDMKKIYADAGNVIARASMMADLADAAMREGEE